MKFNLNTNVFSLVHDNNTMYIDLTDEFKEIADVMRTVLNKWNEVQSRRAAAVTSAPTEAKKAIAMAETLIAVCNKALENGDHSVKSYNH